MSTESNFSSDTPSHDAITARARQLWEKAGSPADRDLEFWLAAESALRNERGNAAGAATREPTAPKRAANRRR